MPMKKTRRRADADEKKNLSVRADPQLVKRAKRYVNDAETSLREFVTGLVDAALKAKGY